MAKNLLYQTLKCLKERQNQTARCTRLIKYLEKAHPNKPKR